MPATSLVQAALTRGAWLLFAVTLCGCAAPGTAAPPGRAGTAAPTSAPAASARSSAAGGGPSPAPAATDPPTVSALLKIAQTFNNEYDNGDFGAVWDRWDARSQALITRSEYIRRHLTCAPATHAVAQVETATRSRGGAWLVSYRIEGSTAVDTWYYVRHRWVFDIVASNPAAARQYAMPFARYAAAVGCVLH